MLEMFQQHLHRRETMVEIPSGMAVQELEAVLVEAAALAP
jgi:hypothetical protein